MDMREADIEKRTKRASRFTILFLFASCIFYGTLVAEYKPGSRWGTWLTLLLFFSLLLYRSNKLKKSTPPDESKINYLNRRLDFLNSFKRITGWGALIGLVLCVVNAPVSRPALRSCSASRLVSGGELSGDGSCIYKDPKVLYEGHWIPLGYRTDPSGTEKGFCALHGQKIVTATNDSDNNGRPNEMNSKSSSVALTDLGAFDIYGPLPFRFTLFTCK
jgi:hypothetical protein